MCACCLCVLVCVYAHGAHVRGECGRAVAIRPYYCPPRPTQRRPRRVSFYVMLQAFKHYLATHVFHLNPLPATCVARVLVFLVLGNSCPSVLSLPSPGLWRRYHSLCPLCLLLPLLVTIAVGGWRCWWLSLSTFSAGFRLNFTDDHAQGCGILALDAAPPGLDPARRHHRANSPVKVSAQC